MHRIGDTIDERYQLTRPLGIRHGAEMWEAEHQVVGRTVTLKILASEVAADPAARKRLVAEASAAAEVGHPSVVEVYDVGVAGNGVPYLVTEPIRGEALADIIARQGALQPEDACEIALQLLGGLEAAHAAGIVHGDLHAENVIVKSGRSGQLLVKILDFGLSLPVEESDPPTGSLRSGELDPLVDLQAVGALLFEMLTGRTGTMEPLRAQEGGGAGEVTQARALVPAIPAGLARIVDFALSPRSARRLGSAKEMASLLAPFAESDRTRSLAPRNTLTPFLSPEARRTRGMDRLERAVLGLGEAREKEKTSVRPNLVLLDRTLERNSDRPPRSPGKSASSPPRLAPHELVEPRIPKAPRAPKHFMSHKPRQSGPERGGQRVRSRKHPSLPLRRWKAARTSSVPAKSERSAPRSIAGLRLWSAGLVAMAGLSAGLLLARLLHF
jgi:serine/threonine protein kinase